MATLVAAWPMVALGEVLRKSENWVELDSNREYAQITVRLWGKGVALRGRVTGAQIAASRQLTVKANQFILSRIDARNGALGLVPPELDGAVVSSDFPVFDVDPSRLMPEYLAWMSKTNDFVRLCRQASEGTTNRVRLKEQLFLATEIPLPPLGEQRRIVARIAELAARIERARGLRREAMGEADRLLIAMAHRGDWNADAKLRAGWREIELGQAISLVSAPHRVDTQVSYPNLGIYSFGRGLFPKPPIAGISTSANTLYRVRAGQFIYSRLFAFEGAYGIVTDEFDGCFVSNEYPTFECDEHEVIPTFLSAYFKSADVWRQVATGSKGLGHRRQRVQPPQILAHRLWLPPLEWQRQIAGVRARLDTSRTLQMETDAELDALLPSVLDRAFRGEL